MADNATAVHDRQIKQLTNALHQLNGRLQASEAAVQQALSRPQSPTEAIDSLRGRRIESMMVGTVDFDATAQGTRGAPVTIVISQDGPFVQTHYPLVLWFPIAPTTATDIGIWRPVSTFPLPDQVVDTSIIDIQYEISDGGAGRNFQNAARGPMFSRPDALQPLPMPTVWAPNSTIQFFPTYNHINFGGGGTPATPATAGRLHVSFPGYRIVNL